MIALLHHARHRIPEITVVVSGVVLWATRPMVRPFLTPDAVSYASITEHWVAGRWSEAINGYWSPLYSWLLVPFHSVGVPHPVAFTIIGLAVSILAIDRTRALCVLASARRSGRTETDRTAVDRTAIEILLVGTIPFHLFTTFNGIQPDRLMAALAIGAIVALCDPSTTAIRRGVSFGLWAAAAVLAKVFALPFLAAAGAVWVVVRWILSTEWRPRIADVALGFGVLGSITLAWSAVLTIDYGEPTFNRAITYNAQVTAPFAQGDPFRWAGLLEPTNDAAVSAWEDPSTVQRPGGVGVDLGEPAADLVDVGAVDGRVERIVGNLRQAIRPAALFAGTAIVAALATVPILLSATRRARRRLTGRHGPGETSDIDEIDNISDFDDTADATDETSENVDGRGPDFEGLDDATHIEEPVGLGVGVLAVLSAAVYVGGISLATVEARYLWPPLLLTVGVAAWALAELRARGVGRSLVIALAAVIALSSSVRATVEVIQLPDVVRQTEESLRWMESSLTAETGPVRIAALSASLTYTGLCLEVGCTYWGTPIAESGDSLARELRDARIDLLLVRSPAPEALDRIDLPGAVVVESHDGVALVDVVAVTGGSIER